MSFSFPPSYLIIKFYQIAMFLSITLEMHIVNFALQGVNLTFISIGLW